MFNVRNRLITLLCRILGTSLVLTLLVLYIASADGLFWIARFEIQVGLLFCFICILEAIFNAISLRFGVRGYPSGVYMPLKLPVTTYAIIASLMYMAFPFAQMGGEKTPIGASFALSMLVYALADWIFFDEKGTVKVTSAFYYAIYPLFYIIFNIFRPVIFGETAIYHSGYAYPYQFLEPANGIVVSGTIISLVVVILFGLAAILLNDVLSGKFKKHRQD